MQVSVGEGDCMEDMYADSQRRLSSTRESGNFKMAVAGEANLGGTIDAAA